MKDTIICIFLALVLFNFTEKSFSQTFYPEVPVIPQIVPPLVLNPDTTTISLSDFLVDPDLIDSVSFSKGISFKWEKKSQTIVCKAEEGLKPMAEWRIWCGGFPYSVLLRRSEEKNHEIVYDPNGAKLKRVSLVGDMNNWANNRDTFHKEGSVWKINLKLVPGNYEYQIVADNNSMPSSLSNRRTESGKSIENQMLTIGPAAEDRPSVASSKLGPESFTISIRYKNTPFSFAVYWQNFRLGRNNIRRVGDEFLISIPEEAKKVERSYIRVFCSDSFCMGNDLLLPLKYGRVVRDPDDLKRTDQQSNILYYLLNDRFFDGDSLNDKQVVNPALKPNANFHGGDLAGILQKFREGYFNALNINTILLSPVVCNPDSAYQEDQEPHQWSSGYHGFWPVALTRIDHRFGTDSLLREIISRAHKGGFNVMMEIVTAYVHQGCPVIDRHPQWRTQIDLADGPKNICLWSEYPNTTWPASFLPRLDLHKSEVLRLEVDSCLFWTKQYDLDGLSFRDANQIPNIFWQALSVQIKRQVQRPFYLFGESGLTQFQMGDNVKRSMLDGQMDMGLYQVAQKAFAAADVDFEKLGERLKQSLNNYGSHHLMENISGNADLPRFASLAGEFSNYTGKAEAAEGPTEKDIMSQSVTEKMELFFAFISAIPGLPVLYYGDEIAMTGTTVPDNRGSMVFDTLNKRQLMLKKMVSVLFDLRRSHMALMYGETDVYAKEKTLIIVRSFFSERVIFVFNKSNIAQTIETGIDLSASKPQFGHPSENSKVNLPPLAFEVFIGRK